MQISLPIVVVLLCVLRATFGSRLRPWSSARYISESNRIRELDVSYCDLVYLYSWAFLEMKVTELLNLNLASNLIRCVDQQTFLGLAE
jgi:hypothetical protein